MPRLLVLLLVALSGNLFSQTIENPEVITLFSGKLINAEDSSLVSGTIRFTKLPNYDDMHMHNVSNGSYEIQLIEGLQYEVTFRKEGFLDFSEIVTITSAGTKDFYIKPDVVELIKLENLFFRRASPDITPNSYEELDRLADWLNENPTIVIQLEGHTDFRGNAEQNMLLSQARVESVKEYLSKEKKVKDRRILTKAFGGTQPISREDTDEAKAQNRRVEVRVIKR